MKNISGNTLRQALRARGLKSTRQRDEIVRTLQEAGSHVTVAELYQRVQRKNPGIGYATVHRTMRLLAENGWAAARQFGDRAARFEREGEGNHHDHLICVGCGKITEFANMRMEALQNQIAQQFGFQVRNHKLELYGHCQTCRGGKGEGLDRKKTKAERV